MNAVLRLDASGLPQAWLNHQDAVSLMATDSVLWSMGDIVAKIRGGLNRATGERSLFEVPAIIGTVGSGGVHYLDKTPTLNNDELFARDRYMCMYCGETPMRRLLTRDHVFPQGRGGPDIWTNVVTACFRCNNRKGCKTPSEAAMPLLAVPYAPNYAEWLTLKNRNILGDQMSHLQSFFKQR